jgi:hypothetical protein
MQVTWLHVSDFHIRGGDSYDRDVVLRALVKSVQDFRERGRTPDLVFATGDIAQAGKAHEYDLATQFFDASSRQRRLPVSSHPSWPCPAPPSGGLPAPPLGQRRPPPPACGGLRPVPWSPAFPQGRSATAAVLLRAACRAGPPRQRRRSRG